MREYQVWMKHEKLALDNFAEKYVIEGKPKIIPIDYFEEKTPRIKEFLTNHRNIKIRMLYNGLFNGTSILRGKNYNYNTI